jgi:hypothetical protein
LQLPHRGKSLASRVFHLHHNTIAPGVFYLDLDSTAQAPVPGIFRYGHCAIEKVIATAVFGCRRRHSASILFHLVHLFIALVVVPDCFLNEVR